MESEGRVMAGGEDHVQQWWAAREQELQLGLRFRRDQLMHVVDHEHDGLVERLELRDQAPYQPVAVEFRRRLELLNESISADRGAQPVDDRQPESLGVAFMALHQHPGRPFAEPGFIDPRAKQHGLAAAGRRRHERDASGDSGRQALVQRSSCDDARSADADGLLGNPHAVIVARGWHGSNGREWAAAARSLVEQAVMARRRPVPSRVPRRRARGPRG